jgi:hypothetical protein
MDDALPPVVPRESRDFCTAYDEWMAYKRKGVVDAHLQTLEDRVKAAYQLLPPVKIAQGGKPPGAVKMHPWDLP